MSDDSPRASVPPAASPGMPAPLPTSWGDAELELFSSTVAAILGTSGTKSLHYQQETFDALVRVLPSGAWARVTDRVLARLHALGTDWGQGVEHRARCLLALLRDAYGYGQDALPELLRSPGGADWAIGATLLPGFPHREAALFEALAASVLAGSDAPGLGLLSRLVRQGRLSPEAWAWVGALLRVPAPSHALGACSRGCARRWWRPTGPTC